MLSKGLSKEITIPFLNPIGSRHHEVEHACQTCPFRLIIETSMHIYLLVKIFRYVFIYQIMKKKNLGLNVSSLQSC